MGTHLACTPKEEQVIIDLFPPGHVRTEEDLTKEISDMEGTRQGGILFVQLHVRVHNETTLFELKLRSSCISGLLEKTSVVTFLPSRRDKAPSSCSESGGAVVVGGSPLFGSSRDDPQFRKQVAHFAVRALLGPIQFDVVAIPVLTRYSISEIQGTCRTPARQESPEVCGLRMHDQNAAMLSNIAHDVTRELIVLGLPSAYLSRVVMFPFCTLGTDYTGREGNGSSCAWGKYNSQYASNDHGYTVFSPYFKWTASFDIDETILPIPSKTKTENSHSGVFARAADEFDRIEIEQSEVFPGFLMLRWLDVLSKPKDWKMVTQDILLKKHIQIYPRQGEDRSHFREADCRGRRTFDGKPVVSCKFGMGMSTHDSIILVPGMEKFLDERMCSPRAKENFNNSLLLYHLRASKPRFGNCTTAAPLQ